MPSDHAPLAELALAICEVVKACEYVQKTGENPEHGYKYATDADLLYALRTAMVEQGLALVPSGCDAVTSEHSPTKAGGRQWRTDIVQTFTLIHKGGGSIQVQAAGCGLDGQDKGAYKAMTGALKYALRQTFLVPTGDDAEKPGPLASEADCVKLAKALGDAATPPELEKAREAVKAMRWADEHHKRLILAYRDGVARLKKKGGGNGKD